MRIGIGIPQPVPGVLQPLAAIFLGLVRKPRDFVVAPDIELFVGTTGLSLMPAGAEVIEFHQVRQMLATPSAETIATKTLATGRARCSALTPLTPLTPLTGLTLSALR